MLTLSKTFRFAAAHRLYRQEWTPEQNQLTFGKCANRNGHGHNYRLEVSVSGEIDPETGMLLDASKLQRIVDEQVLDHLDHKNLDLDVPWLEGKITTVENLVNGIWDRLAPAIAVSGGSDSGDTDSRRNPRNVRLRKLVLWETERIFATREE